MTKLIFLVLAAFSCVSCTTLSPSKGCRFSSDTPIYEIELYDLDILVLLPSEAMMSDRPFFVVRPMAEGSPVLSFELFGRIDISNNPQYPELCGEAQRVTYKPKNGVSGEWREYWDNFEGGGVEFGIAIFKDGEKVPNRIPGLMVSDESTGKWSVKCGCAF